MLEKVFNKNRARQNYDIKLSGALCSLWLICIFSIAALAQTYTNPVIPGDFPDPSVIRVGSDYYATATTGGWAPHYPILHSKDLINWQIVGSVFNEKPAWAKGDFWAPEIAEDNGRFYVFYTARRDEGKNKKGTLCVAVAVSDKPAGTYQDKGPLVCQEMGSIDAFFVRDERNKPFLVWKEDGNDRRQPTWLYAAELDESLTKLKGKPQKLFRNEGSGWENHVIEGADIVRRNGWFYLFYSGNACCGRSCNYALGVARSKTLLGKWEKYENNPILKENEVWQCPGHGTIVRTPDGRDFLIYHAYRKSSDAFNIGREALLDEVKYENGWAAINNGRGASSGAEVPFKGTKQSTDLRLFEEFNENLLTPKWSYPLYNSQIVKFEKGFLSVAPTAQLLQVEKMPEIVLAARTFSGTYTTTTRIDFSSLSSDEFAGISIYGWRSAAVGISLGNGKIFVWQRTEGRQTDGADVTLPKNSNSAQLRIEVKEGEIFSFYFSFDEGKSWSQLGDKIATGSIEGARVALVYNGKNTTPGAKFDWLKVE